ncbi:MAG TPA: hypothetical protein VFR18_20595 [Terriglobia bacterium]|nr:hypothetical protein [Terriglobia bacterium]
MSDMLCPLEHAVTLSTRTGQWSDELRTHISNCAECTDTLSIVRTLNGVAGRLSREGATPHPNLIWLKAELEREQREEKGRVYRAAVLSVAQFVLCLAVLLSAYLLWPDMRSWASLIVPAETFEGIRTDATSVTALLILGLTYGLLFWRLRPLRGNW